MGTRKRRRPRPPRRLKLMAALGRVLLVLLNLFLIAVLGTTAAGLYIYTRVAENLPSADGLARHRPFETTQILARDGTTLLYELVDPQAGRRTIVPFSQIPQILKDATVAVEDSQFYRNPGFDLAAVVRAAYQNYQADTIVSGASTITQQLVRTVLLPPEERSDLSYTRKLREIILAYRVSQEFSKDQILNLYLNEVYYGAQAYGVQAAAQTYFNKNVWELNDAEATLIAGLPQAPTVYNPFTNLADARARQRITLDEMVANGYLTAAEADAIYATPITLVEPSVDLRAPHFVFYVRDDLERRYGPERVYRGGLRVVTSIDPGWQARATEIARARVDELRARDASNAGVIMLAPDGQILAMVGSLDYNDKAGGGEVNVTLAPRQVGSALKPLIYAAALQRGWTPATVLWDTPTDFGGYRPRNYDGSFRGPVSLRTALANSLNIPAVRTLEYVGVENFVRVAEDLGLTTFTDPERQGLAMALGSNEVRLLELTAAYNVLANGGHETPPVAILSVSNSRGEVLERWQPGQHARRPLLGPHSAQIAYLLTSILSDNQARQLIFGPGNVMELPDGRPAAVKTGTSDDFEDSWAVGYTPRVTVGVWVGNNDNRPMQEVAGANGAGSIWRELMIAYHEGQPPEPFVRPDGVVEVAICTPTGGRASEACPGTRTELFVAGTEPQTEDVFFQTIRVAEGGRCLPGPYTPAALIEERRYAIYPPAFQEWAAQQGVPQPPTRMCDPPQFLPASDALVRITAPAEGLAIQRGAVFVSGSARGPYVLEWGRGESPAVWNPVNRGNDVRDNLLGIWQAGDLDPGMYTVRLTVRVAGASPVEALRRIMLK